MFLSEMPGSDDGDTPIGGLEDGRTYRVVLTGDTSILQLKRNDLVNANVYYVRTASADQIFRTSGSWLDDGFKAGDPLVISNSSGNDGTSQITITFEASRDLEVAAVDVQNRVARAASRLPARAWSCLARGLPRRAAPRASPSPS